MSIVDVRKAARGRPAVNATPVTVRIPPELLGKLDGWISAQPDKPSRPEAVRRIISALVT